MERHFEALEVLGVVTEVEAGRWQVGGGVGVGGQGTEIGKSQSVALHNLKLPSMRNRKLIGERWRLTGRTINQGGQGQIHLVVDETGEIESDLALKLLVNTARSDRLDREIDTTKRLRANGVPVLPIIDDYLATNAKSDRPWYVAPYYSDGDLSRLVGERTAANLDYALSIFRRIVQAVLAVHKHEVAHRDLKPPNILLDGEDIVLADFGLCLPLMVVDEKQRLTQELERIGSLHYTPPEAFTRQPLGQEHYGYDAYALGKILYELITGRVLPMFTPPNDPSYDITRDSEGVLYRDLNRILRGLLHTAPEVRLATLGELPDQLDDLVSRVREGPVTTPGFDLDMAEAREVLARLVSHTDADDKPDNEPEFLAREIVGVWDDAAVLQGVKKNLGEGPDAVFSVTHEATSTRLRQLLKSPTVRTHRALEPLEDRGYPEWPQNETGAAVGLVPDSEWKSRLPEFWLGALVASGPGTSLVLALAIARIESGMGWSDLVGDQIIVKVVEPHNASHVREVREAAEEFSRKFAELVVDSVQRL